jgi:lactate dehydrogenase-like 2-hydroxyacid dehydrogenase
MAKAVDILMIAAPGGPGTHHLVNHAVIDALGPDGVIVNVGRGTIIDQRALIDALSSGRLSAAGLDVLENEPDVPPQLAALPNVVLTPHRASLTWDAVDCAFDNAMANIEAHFAGRAVLTPVH